MNYQTIKVLEKELKRKGVEKELISRYSGLLMARAVRFYIDNELDSYVIDEDLYNGEDFDCSCSQKDADNNQHKDDCEFIKYPYPNIRYSEKHERDYQKEILKSKY